MKVRLSVLFVLLTHLLLSQPKKDELYYDKTFKKEVERERACAFIQYSHFIPSNFKEIFISVSGNSFVDSLLIDAGTDTLISNGAEFFDHYFRKDFALESVYSPVTHLFAKYKMYDSNTIKSAIVLIYSLYLNDEKILMKEVQRKCLHLRKKENRKARKVLKRKLRLIGR